MMAVLEYSSTLYCTCVQSYLRARYSYYYRYYYCTVVLSIVLYISALGYY